MNDLYDYRRAPDRLRVQFEAARSAGSWMPWAGAALAVLLVGGIGAWVFASMGLEGLLALPPLALGGGIAAILAPGIALICAGVMARESARSTQANAVVLASARMLLEPAEHARSEVVSIAEAISSQTDAVNRSLADARGRLDQLKHDIDSSVTAALKACEIVRTDSEVLVNRMSAERQSMAQLAESLRNQSESLAKAIPRHAQMMSDAARTAQEQVGAAEASLDRRLKELEDTAAKLSHRIDQLDTMGAESRKRAQNLGTALMRLDEQLMQSTRMVEAATKAGELASAATKSTAETLRDAVSDALGSALKATETINARAAQAAEDAQLAMSRLKEAGLHAETTTRAASLAAKAQADETEQRINQLSEFLFRAATKATNAAEAGLERARERIEQASLLIGQIQAKEEPRASIDDMILEPATPVPAPPSRPAPPAASPPARVTAPPSPAESDALILDQRAPPDPRMETLRPPAPKPTASAGFPAAMRDAGATDEQVLRHIESLRRPIAPPEPARPAAPDHLSSHGPLLGETQRNGALSWRDLLTGIEEVPEQARDKHAGQMIDRLDRAGIRLGIVKASDLRRIASAAHQGERQRRRAIRDVAPAEIQRVSRLLDTDRDLQVAAQSFVTAEEPDALRVLASSERAREDAHPRLSAYLLLDAALGQAI